MKEIILNHLNNDYTDPVRDPVWGNIYLSKFLRQLIQTPDFAKLAAIRQLGPTIHVYPGATHTRYNHSLGVYHAAKTLIRKIVQHEECPPLTLTGVKSFLNAALLHDLGHFPYTHSLKELPLIDHEQLSARIILDGPLGRLIESDDNNSAPLTAAIIDQDSDYPDSDELPFYRSLLSGVLDPDKLDYLNRDAYFCGVPYGIQDTDFVLSQIIPTPTGLAISEKGTLAVENILFSKYLMYKAVYWHRDVRISTALIKKALTTALNRGELNGNDLYGLTDSDFSNRVKKLSPQLVNLVERSENPLTYRSVLEKEFDCNNEKHREIQSLDARNNFEKELALKLQREGMDITPAEIIIDVPENISFEVNLPVKKDGLFIPFTSTGTLFSSTAVKDLTRVLRKIRVLLPREKVRESEIQKIIKIAQI